MLDVPSLEVLLKNGAIINDLGVTESSLLHWVVVVAQLDNTPERQKNAEQAVRLLIEYGASADVKNKLGKTPLDYSSESMKNYILSLNK